MLCFIKDLFITYFSLLSLLSILSLFIFDAQNLIPSLYKALVVVIRNHNQPPKPKEALLLPPLAKPDFVRTQSLYEYYAIKPPKRNTALIVLVLFSTFVFITSALTFLFM
jgi:hypothetical protein